MTSINGTILNIRNELETAIQFSKCQKCGCMRDTLDNLSSDYDDNIRQLEPTLLTYVR